MIYVSKNQLKQVAYLVTQSIQGNHVLFDIESVRSIFMSRGRRKNAELSEEEAYAMEPHIERVFFLPSLEEKRAYLRQLDEHTFEKVVKTYFQMVETNILERTEVFH